MGLAAGCMFASMRFFANGPSIPDELLVSRDEGDVIFFCGAGVSQAKAGLRNFEGVAGRYDFVKYPQRGISEDSEYIGRWDGSKNAWIGVSKAGGTPL